MGFLKNLFSKGAAKPASPPAEKPQQHEDQARTPKKPAAAPGAAKRSVVAPLADSGETVSVPLRAILAEFPQELKPAISGEAGNSDTVEIPIDHIKAQLGTGVVRVLYSDLRARAPQGLLAEGHDDQSVSIPLSALLPLLPPEAFQRRTDQKETTVPDDITDVFNSDGKPPAQAAAPAPVPEAPKPEAPKPEAPKPEAPKPEAPKPEAPKPEAPKPEAPKPEAPKPEAPKPEAPKPEAPKPEAPKAEAPKAEAPKAEVGRVEGGTLLLPLSAVMEKWPEDLKSQLNDHADKEVSLELGAIEPMMRKGKVAHDWATLRGMITPAIPESVGADQAGESLDIPIGLVIPHFMASAKPAAAQREVAVDQTIPDLFQAGSNKPPAAEAPAPAAEPAPAPAAAPKPAPATAPSPSSKLGSILGQPGKTAWSPTEVVDACCNLSGVAGAVVTLQDGLEVARKLPGDVKGDAMAAFLPEMYGKIRQYAADIQLGSPETITVQTGGRTLLLLNTGKIYFAALGKTGESIPTTKLSEIARELANQQSA